MKTIFITGGAGFIGSEAVHQALEAGYNVVNIDALTYSGNLASLYDVENDPHYTFVKANICDKDAMDQVFKSMRPDAVLHLAAETHVDRSIDGPGAFIETNVHGTYILLEAARNYVKEQNKAGNFRFLHISTDEVFGDLSGSQYFTEESPYAPSSPYSASKAASDHLVRAWQRTYGLPTLITNCSNNYGPRQFPEKLIPLVILRAREGKTLPVYGNGAQIRDWLYVADHVRALLCVLERGNIGETYVIGCHGEKKNIEVVRSVCDLLDERIKKKPFGITSYRELIRFVQDRPGHDARYAIDPSKIMRELGWKPMEDFRTGMAATVDWYLKNEEWWRPILDGSYHGERLGTDV